MDIKNDRTSFLLPVGLFFLSLLCFDLMSVLVRVLSQDHTAQDLSAWRNLFGIFPSLIVLIATGELRLNKNGLRFPFWKLAALRGMFVAGAQFALYSAIGLVELATVSTLSQTSALFVVLLSVVLLKHRVGVWSIIAVLIGFAGTLLIIRPGSDSFDIFAILPVLAAFGYAVAAVTSRLFPSDVSSAKIYVYSAASSAIAALALASMTSGFAPVLSLMEFVELVAMGLLGGTAALLQMLAYRLAAPSLLAPLSYFSIVTAYFFGWLIFNESPYGTLFPGVLFIIAGGAIILWRGSQK